MIRKIIKTLAVIFFTIQFQQSVKKYFQYPRVVLTSRVPIVDLPAPVVYVCQDDQFDNKKAQPLGYANYQNFMQGILNNNFSTFSWNGINGNISYQILKDQLFNYNYTTLDIWTVVNNKWSRDSLAKQMTFLIPYGVCKKISGVQPSTRLWISSTRKVTILFVDSARANKIRLEETLHSFASIGPSSPAHYEEVSYKVQYSMYDNTINDGTSCTNYENQGKSYGKCLENNLLNELKSFYGCMPPWFLNTQVQECKKMNTHEEGTEPYWEKQIVHDLTRLLKNKEPDMFKNCLPPCITTNIELQKVLHRVSEINFNRNILYPI